MIAITKPRNNSTSPKESYRPISLLCIPLSLRMTATDAHIPLVDEKLTTYQSGFRPSPSCASKLLNFTQHIEYGYERKMLTGAAFVNLPATYDTVQQRLMVRKLMDMTGDIDIYQVIRGLSNRHFIVQLNEPMEEPGERTAARKCLSPVNVLFIYLYCS